MPNYVFIRNEIIISEDIHFIELLKCLIWLSIEETLYCNKNLPEINKNCL
jgi:hypothetical protein